MSNNLHPGDSPANPTVYQIRIMGELDAQWGEWFDGLGITHLENGDTILIGPVADQAALYSVLRRVRDLGIPLLSLHRVEPAATDAADTKA